MQDKIPCSEIRNRTKIVDTIECTPKQKWRWAGPEWRTIGGPNAAQRQPMRRERSRGRPSGRRQDDITRKEGTTQKTMEDIDGGLHPAVDGQSLDER